jgi:choline dehydrogenase
MRTHADLVIVGAGSAGAVIAARASEVGARDVLLLEAGPDYPDPAGLPADLADGTRNSLRAHDWGLWHRANARGLPFIFPRGKVVGGSSAVNTCIALRGQAAEFDDWRDRGLPDWSYEACLPAFLRLERDLDFGDRAHHGKAGPLPIARLPEAQWGPHHRAFVRACLAMGHPACDDHNAPAPLGVGPLPCNRIDGRRISVAEAYLTREVRDRRNLTLSPRTLVRRVLFRGRRAIGVEVEREGRVFEIHANTVVLSAGAIHTPGILLRSGIGPSADLQRLGVSPVSELPAVGAKLLDHPGVAIILRPRAGTDIGSAQDPLITHLCRVTSPGSSIGGDIHLQAGSRLALPWFDLPLVSVMAHVGRPVGYGTLTFHSSHPRARPQLRPRFFDTPEDRRTLAFVLGQLRDIVEQMRDSYTYFLPSAATAKDDVALVRFGARVNDSGYHPCGTVPMGADANPDAATDGHGAVRGTSQLFVADASLMPSIPAVNINIPTLMIGERFGEWFRDGVLR